MKNRIITWTSIFFASLFLCTCHEPIDFHEEVAQAVMEANKMLLVIESVSPEDQSSNINPSGDIQIQFDRAILLSSVTEETLRIRDESNNLVNWNNLRFNSSTYTLVVDPDPYLLSATKYSISISGIVGKDKSPLKEKMVWTFSTGVFPGGALSVSSNNPDSIVETTADGNIYYTDSATVSYTVEGNSLLKNEGGEFIVSNCDLSSLSSSDLNQLSWIDYSISSNRTNDAYQLAVGQGERNVYAMFRYWNNIEYVYSSMEEALFSVDTDFPTVDVGSDRITNTEISLTPTVGDMYSCKWSGDTGVSFSAANSVNTTVAASTDDNYSINLVVKDKAGNQSSDSLIMVWDTTPPNLSSVSIDSGASVSTSATVSVGFSISDQVSSSTECLYKISTSDGFGGSYQSVTSSTMNQNVSFDSDHNYEICTATVEVQDEAGNTTEASDGIYIDTVAPNPPSNLSSPDPTSDRTPTWTWDSGGNGGAGIFQYKLDGGSWSSETSAENYTPGTLSYGEHKLEVRERDARDLWSNSSSKQIEIWDVSPLIGSTITDRTPLIDWPDRGGTSWTLELWDPFSGWQDNVGPYDLSDLSESQFQVPQDLSPGEIIWRFKSHSTFSTYTSPDFDFTVQ